MKYIPEVPGVYIPGTEGVPSISILVVSRGYHQLHVIAKIRAPTRILILTVPRRYFCCGSILLLVLAVRIYTLVQLLY